MHKAFSFTTSNKLKNESKACNCHIPYVSPINKKYFIKLIFHQKYFNEKKINTIFSFVLNEAFLSERNEAGHAHRKYDVAISH